MIYDERKRHGRQVAAPYTRPNIYHCIVPPDVV